MPIYVKYSGLTGTNTITGNIGVKQVNCALRPAKGGSLPPGTYHISAPIKDPIYGLMAMVSSVEGGHAQVSSVEVRGWDPVKRKEIIGADKRQDKWMPVLAMPIGSRSDVVTEKVGPDRTSGGQVFVLCDKPVLGRNTLVVSMGFADLMDALHSSGGATFTYP